MQHRQTMKWRLSFDSSIFELLRQFLAKVCCEGLLRKVKWSRRTLLDSRRDGRE